MENIGFIGFGSIGSMLVTSFIKKKIFNPNHVYISEPGKEKTSWIKAKFPGVHLVENIELAQKCDCIFICVKPADTKDVFLEIVNDLNNEVHLISIAAGVTISSMEKIFRGKITRAIPSYTSEVFEGVTLVCHNSVVSYAESAKIEKIFNGISTVKRIKESDFELATDLTSCGPGWIAHIFDEFVNAALRQGKIPKEDAEEMVIMTLFGTAKLLYDKKIGFNEVVQRVATKGGITEEGISIFKQHLPALFDEVISRTLKKLDHTRDLMEKEFSSKS